MALALTESEEPRIPKLRMEAEPAILFNPVPPTETREPILAKDLIDTLDPVDT